MLLPRAHITNTNAQNVINNFKNRINLLCCLIPVLFCIAEEGPQYRLLLFNEDDSIRTINLNGRDHH